MNGPEVAEPDAGNLPRRLSAAYRGTARPAVTPVPREFGLRVIRGLCGGWDVLPPRFGCLWVAMPHGADPLTDPSVIGADSVAEIIQMIAETAAGAR